MISQRFIYNICVSWYKDKITFIGNSNLIGLVLKKDFFMTKYKGTLINNVINVKALIQCIIVMSEGSHHLLQVLEILRLL